MPAVARRLGWGLVRLLRLGVLAVLVVAVLVGVLTQTNRGREVVLREVLARVERAFRGQLDVEGISSPGLLRGFTFTGVRLVGEDGRAFLTADSVRAGLSAASLLSGDLVFTRVEFWRPHVTLERLPGQEELNVVRIFVAEALDDSRPPSIGAGEEPPPSGGAESPPRPRRSVALRDLQIHQGVLEVLLPLGAGGEGNARFLLEPAPDGRSSLRRMTFRDLELELSEALLVSPQLRGQRFGVEELSFTGEVWPEPFRVDALRGQVRVVGSRLLASVEAVRLASSTAEGRVEVRWGGDRGVEVEVQGEADPLALEDRHFLEPRLPVGAARGPFALRLGDDGLSLDFQDTALRLAQGRMRARGGFFFGREVEFRDLALELDQVDLAVTDPWLPRPIPLRGRLTGPLRLGGRLDALGVQGNLTFQDSVTGGSSQLALAGTLHLGETLGATGLAATLAPLEWATLAGLSPGMRLRGPGALRLQASGTLSEGLRLEADVTHVPSHASPSRVTAEGTVRLEGAEVVLDLRGELRPLSLTSLQRDYPELPATGEVSGGVVVRGPLSDLTVDAELATRAGPLDVSAQFDARRPGEHYALDARARDFLLSELLPKLPAPTRLSGWVRAQGRGLSPDSLSGEAEVFLGRGEVGPLQVDTVALVIRAEGGLLSLDALMARTALGSLDGEGSLGLSAQSPPGEMMVRFQVDSLTPLRPLFMEVPPVIYEDLSDFDRDLLILEGVDPDTLPRAADVALEGRIQGHATLRGWIGNVSGEGALDFQALRFRADFVESGTLTFSAQDLPGEGLRVQARLSTDSLFIADLSFTEGEAEVDLGRTGGRVEASVARSPEEGYSARGTFALDHLTFRFDSIQWNLAAPTALAWSPEGVSVRDFLLLRPGAEPLRLRADGFFPLKGEGDFDLEVQNLNLARVAQLLQMEEAMEGTVDARLRVTGPPDDPRMVGSLEGRDLRRGHLELDSLSSNLEYRDRSVTGEVVAGHRGRRVLSARGTFPADLRSRVEGPRVLDEPVDLTLVADSFPASLALAFLEVLEEVSGTLSGEVKVGGTPRDLAPRGDLKLVGGSMLLPFLGVRHTEVEASLGLRPDGTVEVDGSLRSGGTARVTGTVTLDPLTDPLLDLRVRAQDFLAVDRRDVRGRVSGDVSVLKSYRRPRVEGAITVEQGLLMVEELARSVEVVDLSDPAYFNVVDTTLASLRPVLRTLQASQNPFLQNLQLNLQATMARDNWLRGRDMNVEMVGELSVFFDRTERDLALVGDLEAVRGVYSVLGRQFQVQDGTVSFQGAPGINPDLNIRALTRLRTSSGDRWDVTATVTGTLLDPRVSLSSNASFPISESDLVSYLVFGRPSYALASGESSYVKGAAGSLLGAATEATANLAVGLFSSELGSVFTRGVGLDYFAISQEQRAVSLGPQNLVGTMAATQVEIGQYLTQDIFAALTWKPLSGGGTQDQFSALRAEWRFADLWTLEGLYEDRFARSPFFRSRDAGYKEEKTLRFLLYREWGY